MRQKSGTFHRGMCRYFYFWHRVMMHPTVKNSRKIAPSFLSSVGGVHHSALWRWNYVGENPICEPERVFLQILPKCCHIRARFEGKEKDPPYLASLFPELMSF